MRNYSCKISLYNILHGGNATECILTVQCHVQHQIYNTVKNYILQDWFWTKRNLERDILTEEKLADIGAQSEILMPFINFH
jgi:hypothetical protein